MEEKGRSYVKSIFRQKAVKIIETGANDFFALQ
jgi:hypothetical protein